MDRWTPLTCHVRKKPLDVYTYTKESEHATKLGTSLPGSSIRHEPRDVHERKGRYKTTLLS